MKSHGEIPARHAAFFQQGFGNAIDNGRRDSNGTEPRKARRCDSEDFAVRVNYGAANGSGLQADIKPDVWGKRGTSPGTAFRDHKAHNSKRCHGTASARPPHDQSDATWLNCRGISKLNWAMVRLRASQDGKIRGRIAATESPRRNAAIGQRYLNIFIVAKRVFRGDNDAITPKDAS